MNIRKRLKPEEAKHLDFEPKEKDSGGNARYDLTEEQCVELYKFRNENQQPKLTVFAESTMTDAEGNVKLKWTKTSISEEEKARVLKAVVDGLKDDITPVKPIEARKPFNNDNLCNQYTITDYHLGMMAWDEESGDNWDLKIAESVLIKFFKTSIDSSPKCNKAIFAQLGDFLHWDGLDAVTPQNHHILDADTRYTKLVRTSIRVIKTVITMLLQKYQEVDVIMAEGNHDQASSVWLRELLYDYYLEEPRVNVETRPDPYYANIWGKTLNFYHHGHKRNIKNIDSVFVSKFKKEFGTAEYIYGHLGHYHQQEKETNLMVLERHRTLASKDAYASRGGYMSGRDAKVITYHKEYGEVGRQTFNIKMLK